MIHEPTVWLLIGDKLGDNAQVEVVARALDWPVEPRRLAFREPYVLGKPRFVPDLFHVDLQRSDPIEPPWPDLILTIGRRPAMVALWIKAQSGGRSKIVLFGRPKRFSAEFDLIVAPPQYHIPAADNLLQLDLPLIYPDAGAVEHAARNWQPRLDRMPRPLVAVMVGGTTKPYRLDADAIEGLIDQVQQATGGRGSLYFSTSRRTRPEAVSALERLLPANARLYRFGIDPPEDNPYRALLALADGFVVTGDSVSMLVEVVRMGKPLAVYPLPLGGSWLSRAGHRLTRLLGYRPGRPLPALMQGLMRLGVINHTRDLEVIHQLLYRKGWAVSLCGRQFPFPRSDETVPDEVAKVVARIRAMYG
ncbi:MAG TPA: nucleoside-diphosphate sugar epimerase [Methylothermaceae bacterium]|nr:nucleoside-diphosphate sugar epimerase [Methylothermaceae bacterium]